MIARALASRLAGPRALPYAYGAVHLVVDASTVTVVTAAARVHGLSWSESFFLVVAYDVLAFGLQSVIGAVIDRLRLLRTATALGLVVTAASVAALPWHPTVAMGLAGVGNAAFHVGAGALTLSVSRGRAAPNGIFVAPGALGLGFGLWYGRSGIGVVWPFFVALALGLAWTLLHAAPPQHGVVVEEEPRRAPEALPASAIPAPWALAALLLSSIVIRAFVGFAGAYAVAAGPGKLVALSFAAFAGKALGGVVSDRFGWLEASVTALLASAPLVAFGGGELAVVAAGMLLFQMTMPVTLAALARIFPERPALCFGLTCLALVLGVLPTFHHGARGFYGPATFLPLVVLSAGMLFVALRLLRGPRAHAAAAAR